MGNSRLKIKRINSNRNYNRLPYWHLVYEWEDQFSQTLDVPVKEAGFLERIIIRYFLTALNLLKLRSLYHKFTHLAFRFFSSTRLDRLYCSILRIIVSNKRPSLYFEMYPKRYYSVIPMRNKIPYIIDFDLGVDLQRFYYNYRNCPIVFISGREAYNYLTEQNCPVNIKHLALSISDKYRIDETVKFEKKYDIIIAGRHNKFLNACLLQFVAKHPEVEYLVSETDGAKFYYRSNKRGIIGEFPDRASFLNLLSEAKIAFYATPGIDDKDSFFINHVTSRLFELVYSRCFIVGRYPDNEEVKEFNISEVCPGVKSYEEFESLILQYLNSDISFCLRQYQHYLEANYTSKRAKRMLEIINAS